LLNTESLVGEAVIKGRLIGKLATEARSRFIHLPPLKAPASRRLVIPAGHHLLAQPAERARRGD
jgi:hypothetical protein